MDDQKNYSRVNKYDKRRKTTQSITILMAIAVVLVIVLIAVLIFGGKGKEDQSEENNTSPPEEEKVEDDDAIEGNESDQEDANDSTATDEEESDDDTEENNEEFIEIEEIPEEDIEDPNVIEAYTANWAPIGTNQDEPHETVFAQDSDDWKEMIEAIGYALTLEQDEMTINWVGNGGEQRVNGYVQSLISNEHYTVYLMWVENEGWQPVKVERVERFIHPKQAPAETNDENNSNTD